MVSTFRALKVPSLLGPGFFLSSSEVASQMAELARGLYSLDLCDDKPVGLYADNSIEGVVLILSAIALGLPVAMIPLGEPALKIDAWLNKIKAQAVIYSSPTPDLLDLSAKKYGVSSLRLSSSSALQMCKFDTFSSIIRTSGSTGEPKNALIDFRAHMASAQSVTKYFDITQRSVFGLNLPLSHVSGLSILFRAIMTGCGIYLARDSHELSLGLSAHKLSHLSLVPAQLSKHLSQGTDLTKLDALIIGGDALPESLAKTAVAQKIRLFSTYGLTETASMVYVFDHQTQKGQVLPHAQITISPKSEIEVKGTSLFRGYLPKTTLAKKKFFNTRDLGKFDDTGVLRVFGRKDNQIICGGENILPEEIEHILHKHPQILQCVVVGKPDTVFGQRLKAYVRWRDEPMDIGQIVEYLSPHLPKFKIPKDIVSWPIKAPLIQKKARAWLKAEILKETCLS